MKTLFKLYLLGQLIALPFLVGAIGHAFGGDTSSSSDVPPEERTISGLTSSSLLDLCARLEGGAMNSIQDETQQVRAIAADLYDEELDTSCLAK